MWRRHPIFLAGNVVKRLFLCSIYKKEKQKRKRRGARVQTEKIKNSNYNKQIKNRKKGQREFFYARSLSLSLVRRTHAFNIQHIIYTQHIILYTFIHTVQLPVSIQYSVQIIKYKPSDMHMFFFTLEGTTQVHVHT